LLSLENGIFFATVTLAPGMPFVVGFLILFDVATAVLFYGVLARLIVARMRQTSVLDMSTLRG
jgi:hydrogenase-4 membrane subunit HyfE